MTSFNRMAAAIDVGGAGRPDCGGCGHGVGSFPLDLREHNRRRPHMNEHAKGCVVVLGPEEGESLWQPLPSTG